MRGVAKRPPIRQTPPDSANAPRFGKRPRYTRGVCQFEGRLAGATDRSAAGRRYGTTTVPVQDVVGMAHSALRLTAEKVNSTRPVPGLIGKVIELLPG